MIRIEAVIPEDRVGTVSEALRRVGVGGLTCISTKGRGKTPIQPVHTGRGTSMYTPEFTPNCTIYVVVKDSDLDKVREAIINAAGTGMTGKGKVFVSNVDEVIDIGSNRRGESVL